MVEIFKYYAQVSLSSQIQQKIHYTLQPSIASNGKYIFILFGKSLYKIGSGFNGTLKGHLYGVNHDFCKDKSGWIGFCGVSLKMNIQFVNVANLCVDI